MPPLATLSPATVAAVTMHDGPRGGYLLSHAAGCDTLRAARLLPDGHPEADDAWPCSVCWDHTPRHIPAHRGVSIDPPERTGPARAKTAPAKPAVPFPNRYAGECVNCGHRVAAEAGRLVGARGARKPAHLAGECPAAPVSHGEIAQAAGRGQRLSGDVMNRTRQRAGEPAQQVTEGMYRDPASGTVWKVQRSRESGRHYAKRLTGQSFTYDPGAMRRISPEWRMTLAEAQEYGRDTGICCVCGRLLTNPESIAAGIGPVCANRF